MNLRQINMTKLWSYVAFAFFIIVLLSVYQLLSAGLLFSYDVHPILRSDTEDIDFRYQLFNSLVEPGLALGRWFLPLLALVYSAQSVYQERITRNFVRRLLQPTLLTFAVTAGIPLIISAVLYLSDSEASLIPVLLLFMTLRALAGLVILALFTPLLIIVAYKQASHARYLKAVPIILIIGSFMAVSVYGIVVKVHFDSCGIRFPNAVRSEGSYNGPDCLATKAARANNPSVCEVTYSYYKDACYEKLIGITNDESLCTKVDPSTGIRGPCHFLWLRNNGQLN